MASSQKKIELLYMVADLGNGGQERQLYYLNRSLKENKRRTAVAVWDFDNRDKYFTLLKEMSVEVLDMGQHKFFWQKIIFLNAFIRSKKVKIFHSFSFHLNFFVWLSCVGTTCKPLGGIRSNLQDNYRNSSFPKFHLNCFTPKHHVSNNRKYNEQFRLAKLHRFLNRVHVVENALDIRLFTLHASPSRLFFKTASIGRLYSVKRIDLLIKSLASLKDSGVNIVHYHAGTGILEDQLKRLVTEMNINEHFFFSGNVENIPQFLSDADLFLHTSEYEGCPNVVMEAMASGKAIVSTDCGDVSLLVQDGINGYVVPVNDIEKFTEKVMHLINNSEKRKEMGRAGRKKAEALFSIDSFRKKTLTVYHQLNKDICVE